MTTEKAGTKDKVSKFIMIGQTKGVFHSSQAVQMSFQKVLSIFFVLFRILPNNCLAVSRTRPDWFA